jgi:hypothetical protein
MKAANKRHTLAVEASLAPVDKSEPTSKKR